MTNPVPGTNRRSKAVVLAATVSLLLSLLPGIAQAAPGGPTLSLTSATANPTNGAIAVVATFSADVSGFVATDVTAANGVVGVVSGGPTVYAFNVTAVADGLVTISVAADQATAVVGGLGNVVSNSLTRTVDTTLPTAAIVFPATTAYTSGTWAALSGTATDTTAVSSVKYSIQQLSGGLYWNGSSFSSGAEAFVTASGTTSWTSTFAFSNFPSDGTYTMRAYSTDTAGNVSAAAVSAFTIDTLPSVTLSSTSVSPTGSVIHVVATFSESVAGFISSDLSVGNATVGSFGGSGASYSFDLFGSSDGTVSVFVPAGVASGTSGANAISNTLSWTFDASGPTVTINQASGQGDPTGASPISFTAVFSASVTGFDSAADVTVGGTAAGTKTVSITAVSTQTYTVAISGMTSSGTVIPTIPADKAVSITGNHPNKASTSTDNSVAFVIPSKWVVAASNYTPVPGSTITITAQLADVNGTSVPGSGIVVGWSNTGGGTFSSATSTTNASGVATVSFTVSGTLGTVHTVTATGNSLTGTSANITVSLNSATLTLTSSASTTTWRQFINLNAQFSGTGGANRLVTFQRMTAVLPGTWVTIGTATSNAAGRATFNYGPPYNSDFRAVFAGATDLSAVTSNTTTVHVRYNVTLSPGAGKTTIVRAGTKITYTATSRPTAPAGLQRVTFLIYKRVNGIWTFRTSASIPTVGGVATFSWRWSRGEWYIRARGNATHYNTTAYSLLSKVTAR